MILTVLMIVVRTIAQVHSDDSDEKYDRLCVVLSCSNAFISS